MHHGNAVFAGIALLLLLTACSDGGWVDRQSPSFVDRDSVKTPSAENNTRNETAPAAPIMNETSKDFVPPPPTNSSISGTGDDSRFEGRSLVTLWIWNRNGSQHVVMAEGTGISIPTMKVSVTVLAVGNDGRAMIAVSGAQPRALAMREETYFGDTWVYVSEIIKR